MRCFTSMMLVVTPVIRTPKGRGATDTHVRGRVKSSPGTILVTVLVVVVTLVVVVIVVVTSPLWMFSVVDIDGFFTTCCVPAGATGLSRQYVLTLFRSFVIKSCNARVPQR